MHSTRECFSVALISSVPGVDSMCASNRVRKINAMAPWNFLFSTGFSCQRGSCEDICQTALYSFRSRVISKRVGGC